MTEIVEQQADSTPVILPIHTSCKDCIFADYDHENETQIGCEFNNRTEAYAKLDCLVEAEDEEKEFFVVNGRTCNAFRHLTGTFNGTGRFVKTQSGSERTWSNIELKFPYRAVRNEIQLKTDVLVPFEAGDSIVGLIETLQNLNNQGESSCQPFRRLYLVSNQDEVKPATLVSLLNQNVPNVEWYITNVQERNPDGSRVGKHRALSHATDKIHGGEQGRNFYVVVPPGVTVPPDLCQKLDELVNDKLEQVTVFVPDETLDVLVVHDGFRVYADSGKPLTVSVPGVDGGEPVTKVLNGMAEKAEFFAQAQDLPNMVRKIGSLWNS